MRIGRYEIYEQLGKGAMGVVHRAKDTVLDRFVALKTIRTTAEAIPDIRERFYREARACARLQHPNIITVYDLGEEDLTAYISMELLSGADLRKVISEAGTIPLATRLDLMAQICDALNHAHSHGVIHRDIKPSNIFRTDGNHAKVLDFGIARLQSSNLTVVGTIMGTPNYMAPEQILARPCDHTADLFSASVVFFELISGAHPFRSGNVPERIVKGQPDSLYEHMASTPASLEKILARGLNKNPTERYRSGAEYAADLRAVAEIVKGQGSTGGLVLPSETGQFKIPTLPQAAAGRRRRPPSGESTQEWDLSEMLRLIPALEQAVARKDRKQAEELFADIEDIATHDQRFGEALRTCQKSLDSLNGRGNPLTASATAAVSGPPATHVNEMAETLVFPQPVIPPAAPAPTPRTASYCSECGRQLAPGDAVCSGCGTPVQRNGRPATPAPAVKAPPVAASIVAPPAAAPVVARAPVVQPPVAAPEQPRSSNKQLLALIAAILIVALGITAIYFVLSSGPKLEASLATAMVKAPGTKLLKAAEPASAAVADLPAGQQVWIIRSLPTSADGWVAAQARVGGKPTRPGYVRATDLERWHADAASDQARLQGLFEPQPPPPATPVPVATAEQTTPPKQESATKPGEKAIDPAAQAEYRRYMSSAENLLQLGQYNEASTDVENALKYRPNSAEAKSLRTRIKNAQELERQSH